MPPSLYPKLLEKRKGERIDARGTDSNDQKCCGQVSATVNSKFIAAEVGVTEIDYALFLYSRIDFGMYYSFVVQQVLKKGSCSGDGVRFRYH